MVLKGTRVVEKVLVCLDGSELAEQILPHVTDYALCSNSTVLLLQVVHEPVIVSPGIPGAAPVSLTTGAMREEAKKAQIRAESYLEEKAGRLREQGLRVVAVATLGKAGETITGYARENNVGLIAMATHGRGGLGRALFGSVADYVLRTSGLPLLIIRPQE